MKNLKIISFLACFILLARMYGQDMHALDTYGKLAFKAAYFGEFVLHPGFAFGTDYTLKKQKAITLHWDMDMGAYFHKWNNNAFFVQSSIGTRFTSKFAAFVDINAGLGYMLSSPYGEIFTVDDDGDLIKDDRPHYSHLKPHLSLLLGWDGTQKGDLPLLIQAGLEAYWQSHFNHILLPHAALRLGVVYRIKNKGSDEK